MTDDRAAQALIDHATSVDDVRGFVQDVDKRWFGSSIRSDHRSLLWCITMLQKLCTQARRAGFLDALVVESNVLQRHAPMKKSWWTGYGHTAASREHVKGAANSYMDIYKALVSES